MNRYSSSDGSGGSAFSKTAGVLASTAATGKRIWTLGCRTGRFFFIDEGQDAAAVRASQRLLQLSTNDCAHRRG